MGVCSVYFPQPGLVSRSTLSQAPGAFPAIHAYTARSTFGSCRSLLAPRNAASYRFKRSTCLARRTKFGPAAWAGENHAAAFSSFDVQHQPEDNSTFKQLCHSQLRLVCTALSHSGDSHLLPDDLDGTLFLGLVGSGAEKALAEAQLVDLPNTGAFVLPLAAHGFLVGLLVLEQAARPSEQAPCINITQPGQIADSAGGAGVLANGSCVLLGDKDREVVRLAGQVLAAACAMDLHSALQRAQASMHSQQVIGLVEEVRGPLTALRTLGSILVPRLLKKEGQEIDRDVAQGILTQGDRLQEVVSQLQAAIHPVALPPGLGSLRQSAVGKSSTMLDTAPKRLRTKRKQALPLLPPVKQDSSADDQLHR